MSVRTLIAALPHDFVLTLVDVGSAGGLNSRWRHFRPAISAVLFDPRESVASGEFGRGATRIYPVALGDRSGALPLHLTAMANMSSFLQPNPEVFERYGKKAQDTIVTGTADVPIERLDTLTEQDGFIPDVLKIDTQGSESGVLGGANASLASVMLAEIEVSFFERYLGQPLFFDINSQMQERGFELIDIQGLKRYRAANSFGLRNIAVQRGDGSGRLAYANAIFLRTEKALLSSARDNPGIVTKAIVALVAYGKADIAARLFDQSRSSFPPEQAAALAAGLKSLRRNVSFDILAQALRFGLRSR